MNQFNSPKSSPSPGKRPIFPRLGKIDGISFLGGGVRAPTLEFAIINLFFLLSGC